MLEISPQEIIKQLQLELNSAQPTPPNSYTKQDYINSHHFSFLDIIQWNKELPHLEPFTRQEYLEHGDEWVRYALDEHYALTWNRELPHLEPFTKAELLEADFMDEGLLFTDAILWNKNPINQPLFTKQEALQLREFYIREAIVWNLELPDLEPITKQEALNSVILNGWEVIYWNKDLAHFDPFTKQEYMTIIQNEEHRDAVYAQDALEWNHELPNSPQFTAQEIANLPTRDNHPQ